MCIITFVKLNKIFKFAFAWLEVAKADWAKMNYFQNDRSFPKRIDEFPKVIEFNHLLIDGKIL